MKLTKKDYIMILKHYGVKTPKTRKRMTHKQAKKQVHALLADKLCRCIKAVQKSKKKYKEGVAIAICNKSIFNNRKLKHYRFTCKKKRRLLSKKGSKIILSKTRKNLKFRPKRKK